jgi:hypothetical protein
MSTRYIGISGKQKRIHNLLDVIGSQLRQMIE